MKITKLEKEILKFIKKNIDVLFIIVMTLIGLFIRYKFRNYLSKDFIAYIEKWIRYIKENGGLLALKDTFSNYNQPYLILLALVSYFKIKPLYLVKIISTIFDIILAFFSAKIVKELSKKSINSKKYEVLTYCIVFILPTVMINSGLWAQCDSIYTLFAIISLYYLIKEKYVRSLIFLGVAFAFKLQFIFILPLYIILYFKERKFSILNFLLIPITNLVLCLPSIIIGHPIKHCFSIYFEQIGYYKHLTMSMFNFWAFIPDKYEFLSYIGYAIVLLIFGILLYLILNKKEKLKSNDYLSLATLSVLICVFFLPNMHERYLYMADILTVIWYMVNKKNIIIPIGIQLVSFISYMPFLFGINEYYSFVCMIFAFVLFKMFNIVYNKTIKGEE